MGPDRGGPSTVAASYSADVAPLFAATCGDGCHVGGAAGGVDLGTYAAVRASVGDQYGVPAVIAGDAGASPLVDKIEAAPRFGARMPVGRAPLSADQIARVRAWIDAGALDD